MKLRIRSARGISIILTLVLLIQGYLPDAQAPSMGFSVAANPTAVTVQIDTPAYSTINVTSVNGFTGTVTLTNSTTPATGIACTLSPTLINLTSTTTSSTSTLTCTGSIGGAYTVTVHGMSGSLGNSASVTYDITDFNIGASPTSVTLTSNGGGMASSTLSCTGNAVGNYTVVVTGTSVSLAHNTPITFKVQDFKIVASPASITLPAGITGSSTITISPINGFRGTVFLASPVSPMGLACSLPSSVNIGGNGSQNVTLSCSGPAGNYTVTVAGTIPTGNSHPLSHSVNVTYVVLQDFSITLTSPPPNSDYSYLTETAFNGFTGPISLSVAATGGLYCVISSAGVTFPYQAGFILCRGLTTSPSGDYTVTVTGTDGAISRSAIVIFSFIPLGSGSGGGGSGGRG